MKTTLPALTCLSLALPLLSAQAQTAQTAAPAAATPAVATAPTAAPLSPTEQAIKDIKNPVSWLKWGGDARARNEYFNNILTLNHNKSLNEQDYFRFRARLWASLSPFDDVSLNARLATEPREWMNPAGYTPYKGHSGWDTTEGLIDNLNVQWKNILGQPFTAVVGRQDIMIGEGWLTGDGTPFDGSWTYFLDAARLSYELKEQHTLLEVIAINQDAKDEGWLPTLNNQNRYLTEQNERGVILNIVNSSLSYANFNPYFIYKHDQKADGFGLNQVGLPRGGDNADIYTLGGRVSGLVCENWKYSAEGAYQFGHKQDPLITDASAPTPGSASRQDFRAISAFGVNSKLSYLFKDKLNNQLALAYEFLSGDDPTTHNDEMFDVLWGRYPRWSEIGLYSFAAETRIGQEANLHRFGPTWSFNPLKQMEVSASYFGLWANQQTATRGSTTLFTDNGTFRGHFMAAALKYKFSSHLSGHLWSEFEFPGDYYVSRQLWSFLRAELMVTF